MRLVLLLGLLLTSCGPREVVVVKGSCVVYSYHGTANWLYWEECK